MQTMVFSGTLINGLEVCVWHIPDDALYFIEVCDPDNIYDRSMDLDVKEAKGVLSYLAELQKSK